MLGNEGQASTAKILLSPVSAANTAAATSAWVDARDAEGDIVVTVQSGAVTGSIAWTVETASTSGGSGAEAITPNEGAFAAATANQVQKRTINAKASKGYVRVVGTIVTGPVLVAANIKYRPKYTA